MNKICGKFILLMLCYLSFGAVIWAQPSADFTYQLGALGNQVCTPVTAGFFNNSSADAVSFEWSINGTVFSVQENPIRNFDQGGNYTVCLTVADASSQTDSSCQIIQLFAPPEVTLTASDTIGCVPIAPIITVSSNVVIDSIYLDFGDGTFWQGPIGSAIAAQQHNYPTPGSYTISMTVWDENGCQTTLTEDDFIEANPIPVASFDASPLSGCQLPHNVTFNNTSPNPGDLSFQWDFGDGNTSTDLNPSHTYTAFGNYTVSLIATHSISGCADTTIINSYINIGDIVAFDYNIIDNGECSNTEVAFTNLTGGNITSLTWDFGDGNTSTDPNPTHLYTTAGCFTPTLTITTADGCNNTKSSPTCIEALGPITLRYNSAGPLISCDPSRGLKLRFQAFSNQSANFTWDFGGLSTVTGDTASFLFDQFGTYPITLSAEYSNGCVQTFTRDTAILQALNPVFTSDEPRGCSPLSVQFQNLTNPIDSIVNYYWEFGDGQTSTLENPNMVFTDTGRYDVTLIVESVSGCRDSITYFDYVRVGIPPVMDFSVDPRSTCIDTILTFTEITSGFTNQWYWNFGDGGESYEQNPTYEYNDTGFFDIVLIAWHNGCTDTLVRSNYVEIKPPIANFSYAQDCATPNTVTFTDNSIGVDVYEWDFGDGQTSSDPNPVHVYAAQGVYDVRLTVYNLTEGCDDFMTTTVNITDANVNYSIGPPNLVCVGDTIQINNSSTGVVGYTWSVPDSVRLDTRTSVAEPYLIFDYPGTFSGFSLTAVDANGCIDTVPNSATITVSGIDVDINYDRYFGCPPLTIDFTAIAQSYNGNIVSYAWDFGDGNTSTNQNPVHTFQNVGAYTITLTVTNDEGCVTIRSYNNLIDVSIPVANFSNYLSDCASYEHTFVNSSGGNYLTHRWDFGDGDTSNLVNPVHSYQDTGVYVVCLEVTNGPGCESVHCDTVIISEIRADFVGDNLFKPCPNPPLVTNFTDQSVGAVSWLWDFGDGSGVSTLQNPSHSYARAGIFTVCLIVTDALGCRDTLCRPDYIQVDGPDGNFSVTAQGGCAPIDISFTAQGQNVVLYNWDFGDGTGAFITTTDSFNTITHTYSSPGEYVPVLILEDPAGCRMPYRGDTIVVEDLQIDLTASVTDFCHTVDSLVDFTADINYFGTLQDIQWTFPGANPATANGSQVNGIVYNQPGTYDVNLRVTTTYCDVSIDEIDLITVHPRPEPAFSYTPTDGCEPLTMNFQDQSIIAFDQITEWLWDFGDGDTSTLQNPVHSFAVDGTYTVRLTVTSDAGCEYATEQDIVVNPRPVIEVGEAPHLCIGESFEIQTNLVEGSSVTYSWTPSANLSCSDCPNPTTTPTDTTLYIVTVTNQYGCTGSDSILVTAGPYALPQVQLNQDTAICLGTTLDISVTTDVSPAQYSWDDSNGELSCTDCPNPVASPSGPSTYVVQVTGPGGCTVSDSVSVDVLIENIDPLGMDRTICERESVDLAVLEGTQPNWSPAQSLSCSNCPNPTASPLVTTTYEVTVLGNLGCLVTDSVTVNVLLIDEVDAGPDTTICFQDAFIPNASFSGSSVWTLNGEVVATDVLRPELYPQTNSTYELVVTNDLCVLSDEVNVTVLGPTELSASGGQICEGDSIQLFATGNGSEFIWTPGSTLSDTSISNPIARPEFTTTYTVSSSVEGCWPISEDVTVTILPSPTPYPQRRINFKRGELVELNANVEQGSGGYIYEWRPADYLSCTECERPVATPDTSIRYEIWVEDQYGCVDSSSVYLKMLEICSPDIFVMPTAFTPNNDGLNDFLEVQGFAEVTLFQVYNRWGELIYSDDGNGNGWDGSYKGKKLNRDVFVYYIEGICPFTGGTVMRSGDVTLLR